MTERSQQIETLYRAALERAVEQREAYLQEVCKSDESLRLEVQALLAISSKAEGFETAVGLDFQNSEVAQSHIPQAESLERPIQSGQQIGRYRVISRIGIGGMGEVWLADDLRLERKVALKILPAKFTSDHERVRRFEQEAKAVSALNHPHIITIHEIGECEAGRYIVMELVEGRTLRTLEKPCDSQLLANLGSQIAKALAATHAAGITHRDIKPDNIMLRNDGYLKVLDFGLARLMPATATEDNDDSRINTLSMHTTPGTLLGTVAYMSPEQAHGDTVTSASDIFSLGIVLYEMATGQHPFTARTMVGMLHSITSQKPLPLSQVNPAILAEQEALILRMLEKDASLRPSAVEVALALTDGGKAGEREISGQKPTIRHSQSTIHTVGREKEMAELESGFEHALSGRGHLLCVAGEPGIGKTTLVEDFLAQLRAGNRNCVIARGRCSERLAGAEAYLPWLEVLENLLSVDLSELRTMAFGEATIAQTMKRTAPSWYSQVASLISGDVSSAERVLAEQTKSQERMKRELCAFVQSVSERLPLVLFFEDLHWADASTIDLLAFLADRFKTMRLIVIATYRLSDLMLAKHPFLQLRPRLQSQGVCSEIAVEFLSRAEIEKYLALEFPAHDLPVELPAMIHAKTEGNPLFMADLVRYLRERGVIAMTSLSDGGESRWRLAQTLPEIERDLPESVRGMIERKIAQLGEDDRRLLVAASVQGVEFDSTVVAQALGLDAAAAEERLETLERAHAFVRLVDERELPDGRLSSRFRFVHVLYQNVLYGSLRGVRRAALSGSIAQILQDSYGAKSSTVASELAFLWETARNWANASENFLLAARNAADIFAPREAAVLASHGLETIARLPDGPERARRELRLQIVRGLSLMARESYGASAVKESYQRALKLCQQLEDQRGLFRVQIGLGIIHVVRGEFAEASEMAAQCLTMAEQMRNPGFLVQAHFSVANTMENMGGLIVSRRHFEEAIKIDSQYRDSSVVEPIWGVFSRSRLCGVLRLLGYPDQARVVIREGLALAEKVRHPLSLADCILNVTSDHIANREVAQARQQAMAAIAYSQEQGIRYYAARGMVLLGWTMVIQGEIDEGLERMREGISEYLATESVFAVSFMRSLYSDALRRAGQGVEALQAAKEGLELAEKLGEHYYESELYRQIGEALWMTAAPQIEVENSFQQAIECARRTSAKSSELRAAISLAKFWRQQGRTAEARQQLEGVYGWFTEGFETADLKDAKALLNELV